MNQTLRLILCSATLLLEACATTPLTPFPASHPASPEAQEAPAAPSRNSLVSDEATKKSNNLLAAAERGTLTPPPAPSNDMSDMPGMNMESVHMRTTSATAAALAVAVLPIRAETFQKVRTEVRDRSGADVRWEKQMAAREEIAAVVAKLLGKPLTVARAVQIALLSNRGLQATFGEIGIAQADVIGAVTVPNPSVDFDVQFPVVAAQMNRYGWLVAQEFVRILMIPLKKKIAEEQLEAAEFRVAAETLRLVAEVKAAYFTYQGEQQLLARLKIIQETNAAALDLAQKQFEVGNITNFALLQSQSSYSQGRLDLAKAETDLRSQREKLNRLMGLWGQIPIGKSRGTSCPFPIRTSRRTARIARCRATA